MAPPVTPVMMSSRVNTGLQPAGEIELEYTACSRASFPAGAVMFFDSLSLRTLRNRRRYPAVLTFLTRTRATPQQPIHPHQQVMHQKQAA